VILETENGKVFFDSEGNPQCWEKAGRINLFAKDLAAEVIQQSAEVERLRAELAAIDQKPPATELTDGEQLHAFFAQIVKDRYLAPWADTLESYKGGWNAIAARIAALEAEVERLTNENIILTASNNGLRLPQVEW
jgi:uncharacterized small protein (DUF1192 family)